MRNPRKKHLYFAWILGSIFALLVVLSIAASWWFSTEPVQQKIHALVTERAENTISFQHVRLSIFPLPHLTFRKVVVAIPKTVTGSVESLMISPDLFSLLTGKLRISKISMRYPVLNFDLPSPTKEIETSFPLSDIQEMLESKLETLSLLAPDMIVTIRHGRVTLQQANKAVLLAKDIRMRAAFLKNGLDINLSGETEQFSSASIEGRIILANNSITTQNLRIALLDSVLASSFQAGYNREGIETADLTIDGTIGGKTVAWLSEKNYLVSQYRIKAPLSFSETRLVWNNASGYVLQGTASFKNGPQVSFDIQGKKDELAVRHCAVRDQNTQAALTFFSTRKNLDGTFSGVLNGKTLARMLENAPLQQGMLRGNLNVHIVRDRIQESTVQGRLDGSDISILKTLKMPFTLSRFSLRAENKTITVSGAELSLGAMQGSLKGTIIAQKDGFMTDMDFSSNGISIDLIQEALASPSKKEEEADAKLESQKSFPYQSLYGVVRITSKYISYGRFTAAPVQSLFFFDKNQMVFRIQEALVCGISLPGTVTITNKNLDLDLRPRASNQPLEPTLACLSGADLKISGVFDLESHVTAKGEPKDLLRSSRGRILFTAKNGEIYRYPLLAKVFSVLNITELLRGKLPDLDQQGFEYSSITVRGRIKNGTILFREAVLDGPTMNIATEGNIDIVGNKLNLTLLIAPFKTVDSLVAKIPLVNKIFDNTLISIPVKVSGNPHNPTITPLAPSAIGTELTGIMKRTLKLPFKIIQPLIKKDEDRSSRKKTR
ncbi:MAG: AsmA-like C-terminal domain-containing protein [Nitrospirota bacterium]